MRAIVGRFNRSERRLGIAYDAVQFLLFISDAGYAVDPADVHAYPEKLGRDGCREKGPIQVITVSLRRSV